MTYKLFLSKTAHQFHKKQKPKTQKIIRENLKKLEQQPHPSPQSKRGDKEKIILKGIQGYRLHISRTYTAFYQIREKQKEVIIVELMTIDQAHKKYGKL